MNWQSEGMFMRDASAPWFSKPQTSLVQRHKLFQRDMLLLGAGMLRKPSPNEGMFLYKILCIIIKLIIFD